MWFQHARHRFGSNRCYTSVHDGGLATQIRAAPLQRQYDLLHGIATLICGFMKNHEARGWHKDWSFRRVTRELGHLTYIIINAATSATPTIPRQGKYSHPFRRPNCRVMPKAEVGSTKYLNNKLKSKGLQRLRWYCQVCEKQNRDENGFKCHVQSESHVRKIQIIGAEGSQRVIADYSRDFQRDFLQLLRTSHNTKPVHINHFYQQYIADKEHIHMNATRWPSLTEFAKHLGQEGICRVEDGDKGLHIAWIDSSPEALRRQEAIRKKDRQDKGDEERDQRMISDQIKRAKLDAGDKARKDDEHNERQLQRDEGDKIKLSFGPKTNDKAEVSRPVAVGTDHGKADKSILGESQEPTWIPTSRKAENPPNGSMSTTNVNKKPKNVFSHFIKKSAAGAKDIKKGVPNKPMSEAERIMKEEIEKKRMSEMNRNPESKHKRPRLV